MSTIAPHLYLALAIALSALVLPGILTLALLTLAGSLPARRPRHDGARGRLALIVPAHNESAGIGRTLASLRAAAAQDGESALIVVADNCDDDTGAIARAAGARVLTRRDAARRGKGYALDYAFRTLLAEDFRFFVVIDADSEVGPGFLPALRRHFGAGALAVQARYTVRNPDASLRTRLMELALCAFNVLRPRGRAALGCSAGLLGNGFGLQRALLERIPYSAGSVVEDLEYHLLLIGHGVRVAFADDAVVRADMCAGARGARSQRARWEGGRLRMLREHAPGLLRALRHGRGNALEPLLDLLLAPLSYHFLLLCALLLPPYGWSRALAALGLLVLALHVLAAAWVGRLSPRHLGALLFVPFYLIWKVWLIPAIGAAAGRHAAWLRTPRDKDKSA